MLSRLERYFPNLRASISNVIPTLLLVLIVLIMLFLGFKITGDHHCGGEIFKVFLANLALLHSDDHQLFQALYFYIVRIACIYTSLNISAGYPLWMSVLSVQPSA